LFYVGLVQNVALLVCLVVIHGQIIRRWNKYTFRSQAFSGFLFGCVALIGMMAPVHLVPGVIFDGRSIVLSVAGLFGGPIVAGIAAIMSASYRGWLGGSGALMGVSVILESAGLGLAFYYLRRLYPGLTRNLYLFAFGLLVHVGMLLLMLALPREAMLKTLENITIPVLLIFPAATWLICLLFLDQESSISAEEAVRESEERHRSLVEHLPQRIFIKDHNSIYLSCNGNYASDLGITPEQVVGKDDFALHSPELAKLYRDDDQACMADATVRDFEEIYQLEGQERWAHTVKVPYRDGQGRVIGVLGIYEDITERKRLEESLKAEKRRFEMLANNAPFGMVIIRSDGSFSYANPKFKEMFGYDWSEVPNGREWFKKAYPDPDYRRDVISAWMEDATGADPGETRPRVFEVTCKDGTEKIINFRPVRLESGENIMTCEDITDRRRYEEAIGRERDQAEMYLDIAGVMLVALNAQGNITMMNRRGREILGYREDEIIGKNWFDVCLPTELREEVKSVFEKLMAGGIASVEYYENPVFTKDGEQRILEFHNTVLHDDSGRIVGIFSSGEDVTERKKAEEDLKSSETRYRQLADVTFEGIIFHDEGVLLRANDQFFQMFGYEPDELVGTQIIEKTLTLDSLKTVRTKIAERSPESYVAMGLRKDGTTFPIEIRARIREVEGKQIRAAAIRDLSMLKNLEAQLLQAQKMEAVGTLAGGIAHDFNNLLQTVLGYSEFMLQRKKEGEPDYADLQKIYQAGKRGADLVKNLLTFSRRVDTHYLPVDLNQEITAVRGLLSRTIPKTININLHLSGNVEYIKADPSQISQVLMNLGVNARDAMPDGGTLTIETTEIQLDEKCNTYPEAKPGSYVLLTISDTGQGMDNETLSHIFEPFFSTKEVGKGTGLGLATVYGIVKQHQGRIICYSELGHGTTFKIYLPAIQTKKELETTTLEKAIAGGTETVLLVDDDDDIRDLVATFLIEFGYSVITAGNGEQALEIYQRDDAGISLIILDLIMPVMDGRQTLAQILRIDPKARVVIASGYSEGGTANGVMESGAKGFVQKPYNMKQLLTAIREILDNDLPGAVNNEDGS
jgi:PAS domain S-box-containing protein